MTLVIKRDHITPEQGHDSWQALRNIVSLKQKSQSVVRQIQGLLNISPFESPRLVQFKMREVAPLNLLCVNTESIN